MKLYQVKTDLRDNYLEAMFFCRLQVSKKFAKDNSFSEWVLVDWLRDQYEHRVLEGGAEALSRAVAAIRENVEEVNKDEEDPKRKLVITVQPMTETENGWIRIERAGGKHQSLLLPIIDFQGFSYYSDGKGGAA